VVLTLSVINPPLSRRKMKYVYFYFTIPPLDKEGVRGRFEKTPTLSG
jgi:hypothetical protein